MPTEEVDVIENTIGRFGKHQTAILMLVMVGRLHADFQIYNVVFILPNVDYVCLDHNAYNITNHCPCENPQYIHNDIVTSATSEWSLICGKTAFASLSQSMVQLGYLPGNIIIGHFADRYGRKPAICVAYLLTSILVSITAVVTEFWMFMAIRFLSGLTVGATVTCSFVYAIELSGASFRVYANAIVKGTSVFGYLSISVIAYYVREWRHLQLITSVPWLFTISYFWMIPESPRWLITVGRREKAIEVLTKIAKRNGLSTENIEAVVSEAEAACKIKDTEQHRGSYTDLFKTPKMRLYTITVALLWMICAHTYYGMNQYVGRLQGNLYVNTILAALVLVPGIGILILVTTYLKRKISLTLNFVLTSVSLLIFISISSFANTSPYVILPFALMGSLSAFTAFQQMYLYTSEVFPTVVRISAVGFASMTGRVGSFLAPFVVNIGVEWVTISIFILIQLFAAAIFFVLPETKDLVLQNTIEQTEQLSHKKQQSELHT